MVRGFRVHAKICCTTLVFCFSLVSDGFGQGSAAVQAPAVSKGASQQLGQLPSATLCVLIDCHKPPKPVITGIDPSSAVTPGGQIVVLLIFAFERFHAARRQHVIRLSAHAGRGQKGRSTNGGDPNGHAEGHCK